jgi:Na+/H+-dicarboxylate symporter/ABC-type amino acid transport substrate-binding protein
MNLATKTLIGMGLGIVAGLVFGERIAFLQVLGDIFIALLQMTVLPYVVVSLICEVGRLKSSEAMILAKSIGISLIVIWIITLGAVLTMPLAFPGWERASFYSSSLVAEAPEFDFVSQYIPINVFGSLAENIVPAVVIFCLALGVTLIKIESPEKADLMSALGVLSEALMKLSGRIASLAPYGVFAIVGAVSGTLRPDEFEQLQVYAVSFIVIGLILIFWTLPALAATVTPASYVNIFRFSRDALVTSFATGSLFVVVPILAKGAKDLIRQSGDHKGATSSVDIAIAGSLSLPTSGKLLTLTYVLFAGWLASSPVQVSNYLSFAVTGLFSFFGSTYVAIPYLMDLYQIPSDSFQYYPAINNLVCARFGTLLAAIHTMVLSVLAGAVASGWITLKARRLLPYLGLTVLISVCGPLGVRLVFETLLIKEYQGYRQFIDMGLLEPASDSGHFVDTFPEVTPRPAGVSRLDWIQQTGRLGVGYTPDALPFAHINSKGNLVGFDVEMAHTLGKELNVQIDFVRIDRSRIAEALEKGVVDLIMSGFTVSPERAAKFAFTNSYMDATVSFVVRDHRRNDFSTRSAIKNLDSPRIGVIKSDYFQGLIQQYLPSAQLVTVNSLRDYFRSNPDRLDALVISAESGSAWTLVYPQFTVAVPRPDVVALPRAYAIRYGDDIFLEFLNTWIALKRRDGTIEKLRKYWIEGRVSTQRQPRWSLIDYWLGDS